MAHCRVLIVTGLRLAALRDAVSLDFSYSQSYLSLLSAAGSMVGIICCGLQGLLHLALQLRSRLSQIYGKTRLNRSDVMEDELEAGKDAEKNISESARVSFDA